MILTLQYDNAGVLNEIMLAGAWLHKNRREDALKQAQENPKAGFERFEKSGKKPATWLSKI